LTVRSVSGFAVPKDSTPTRAAILAAAVQILKRGGLEGFSIAAVARRAGVAKGLVLYHFESRRRLLRQCGLGLAAERRARLAPALAADADLTAIDAAWGELLQQTADGTSRAWLALTSADMMPAGEGDQALEDRARQGALDGCAAALAGGVASVAVRDAYTALWLALLAVESRA